MKAISKNSFYRLPILDGLEALSACGYKISFPLHHHPTFNISLVLEQTFHTRLTSTTCFAHTGAIVITNPYEVHSTICDTKAGSTFFTFYVPPDVLSRLNNKQPVYFQNKAIFNRRLFSNLLSVANHIGDASFPVEKVLQPLLKELVAKYATQNGEEKTVAHCIAEKLEDDLFEKFSLEKTARKLQLDKFKFIRQFKQETGLTPNNYVILRRVEKCKELLQTQTDLLDIAVQTGFYDATHLCKYFRKITGITPMAYHNA